MYRICKMWTKTLMEQRLEWTYRRVQILNGSRLDSNRTIATSGAVEGVWRDSVQFYQAIAESEQNTAMEKMMASAKNLATLVRTLEDPKAQKAAKDIFQGLLNSYQEVDIHKRLMGVLDNEVKTLRNAECHYNVNVGRTEYAICVDAIEGLSRRIMTSIVNYDFDEAAKYIRGMRANVHILHELSDNKSAHQSGKQFLKEHESLLRYAHETSKDSPISFLPYYFTDWIKRAKDPTIEDYQLASNCKALIEGSHN